MKRKIDILICSAISWAITYSAAHAQTNQARSAAEQKATKITNMASEGAQTLWQNLTKIWYLEIIKVGDRAVAVSNIVIALLVLIVGILTSKWLSRYLNKFVLKKFNIHQGAREAIRSLIFYALVLFFFLFALNVSNIPLTIFTVVGGAVALGVGFGSQNVMNNFISGLIMLIERPVRVGDVIDVDGTRGIVRVVGARSTKICSFDNIDIIVPNSSFLEKSVINWTHGDDVIRTKVSVGVVYGSPVKKVIELLQQAASEHDKIKKTPSPFVIFEDFADSALVFELYFWLNMTVIDVSKRIRSDLRVRIDELFRDNDIVIAFPQRDVHLDTAEPLSIKVLDGSIN